MCCTASPLVPSVQPSRQLLLACHTHRQENARLAAPVPANLPSLLKLVQQCWWCGHAQQGSPGTVQPHATFTSSWGAALPQPFGICRVISILCKKQRAACFLRKSSCCAFFSLPPKAVTTCSSMLPNGKAAQYTHEGKNTSHELHLIPPYWLVSPLILIKLPPQPHMNLNTALQSPFEIAFLH